MLEAMRWRRRLADARALLETERKLLLRGAFGELAGLASRRQAVANALAAMPVSGPAAEANAEGLETIRRAAARNARLLAAYRDGAADALARLRALEAKRADIGAYRSDGTRLASGGAAPTLERRA